MPDRTYCTLAELDDDLDLGGNWQERAKYFIHVRAASTWLEQRVGAFTPFTAARRFDGTGTIHLQVDPLLSVTTLVNDTSTLETTDYLLYPRNKHWENGPYTRVTVDPDASNLSVWTAEEDIVVITGSWGLYSETEATGTTVASISDSATTLTPADATKIAVGMVLLVESEQMLVTKETSSNFTVVRGANGTTAAAHTSAAISRYVPPWDVNFFVRQVASLMKKKADSKYAGKTGNVAIGEVFYHDEFPSKPLKEIMTNYRITTL